MQISEVLLHDTNSASRLQEALQSPIVTGVECDLRRVPETDVIGLYHGTGAQIRNQTMGTVLTALNASDSLFTLDMLYEQARGMRILGHVKTDQPYEQMLRVVHNYYLPNYPGLVDRLSFCGGNVTAMQTVRAVLPESLRIWSLNRLDNYSFRPSRNDGVYINPTLQDLTRSAQLGFTLVNIGKIKTPKDIDRVREFLAKTGQNYFHQVWIETDCPASIAKAFVRTPQNAHLYA